MCSKIDRTLNFLNYIGHSSCGHNLILFEYIKLLLNILVFLQQLKFAEKFCLLGRTLNVSIICMVSLIKFLECF